MFSFQREMSVRAGSNSGGIEYGLNRRTWETMTFTPDVWSSKP